MTARNFTVGLENLDIQTATADANSGATALGTAPSGTVMQTVYNEGPDVAYINVAATAFPSSGGFVGRPLAVGESTDVPSGQQLYAVTGSGTANLAVTFWGGGA